MQNKTANPNNEGFQTIASDLEALRDDLRVRIHLAGMELKKVFDDLDRRYLALYDGAKDATGNARDKAKSAMMDLRNELRELRDRVDHGMHPASSKT